MMNHQMLHLVELLQLILEAEAVVQVLIKVQAALVAQVS
jgi:hypothetical protein